MIWVPRIHLVASNPLIFGRKVAWNAKAIYSAESKLLDGGVSHFIDPTIWCQLRSQSVTYPQFE